MSTHEYKFDARFVGSIYSGEKTCTVRLDDERDVAVGDTIEAVVADMGGVFAELRVTAVVYAPLASAYQGIEAVKGKHGADSQADLEERLAEFYPEEELHDDAMVSVVKFEHGERAEAPDTAVES